MLGNVGLASLRLTLEQFAAMQKSGSQKRDASETTSTRRASIMPRSECRSYDLNGRRCVRCGVTKPLDRFPKHQTSLNGRLRRCKDCCRKSAYRYWLKNKRRIMAVQRKWASFNKERVSGYGRAHYRNNRARILSRTSQYAATHREAYRRYSKAYYRRHQKEERARRSFYRLFNQLKVS